MGVPPHLVVPDPLQYRPSLTSPSFSPDSCATSLSLSSSDSSSSSFSQSLPRDADPASNIFKEEEKLQQQQQQQIAVFNMNMRYKKCAKVSKSSSKEPFRECKTASTSRTTRVSVRKACCGDMGAFAADCAAVSCCPLAVLSLLSFVVIDLPSALARKIAIHLQRRLCLKDAASACSIRGGDHSLSIFTPTWSCREASEEDGEKKGVSVIRFSTQNLLEHFKAENVGFGCLSQGRR